MQDILTILYLKGPFTEGIFRKAANEKARKELKEELNSGGKVVFENEPVHLLAVVFKVTLSCCIFQLPKDWEGRKMCLCSKIYLNNVFLQDFLRNIPHKLLLSELYDEWMTALEKMTHHEKTEAMKE